MPRPIAPLPGDEIVSSFGRDLVGYAQEQLVFHRVEAASLSWDLNGVTGSATVKELEIPSIPANNPNVKYAVMVGLVRAAAGENATLNLSDGDAAGRAAGTGWSSGSTVGGSFGPVLVAVGGTNGRSIKYSSGTVTASTKVWAVCVGWYEVG